MLLQKGVGGMDREIHMRGGTDILSRTDGQTDRQTDTHTEVHIEVVPT